MTEFNPQSSYPPQGYPSPQYGYARPELPQATTSMILGLVATVGALFTCGLTLFVSPFAWITAVQARRTLRNAPHQYSGEGRATTGLVLGIIGTVLLVLALIVVVVVIVAIANGDWDTSWDTYYDDGRGDTATT